MSNHRPLQADTPAAPPEQPSPTPATPGVQVEGVNKAYRRGQRVLSDVSLHIRAGETFGIIGPNGAGKTTLFGCMLGLLWPDSGTVRVAGLPPDHLEVRRLTGYLPERLTFDPGLTARQFLAFHHSLAERPVRERPQEVEALLTQVGLDKTVWDRDTRKFSRGMLQRLGLAQALVGQPRVLFLDEPTLGIDPEGVLHLRALLRDIKSRGVTVIINSHDLAQLEKVCDRVAFFRAGRVEAIEDLGSPSATLTRHALVVRWAGPQSLSPEQLATVAGETGATLLDTAEDSLRFSVEDDWGASRLLGALLKAGLPVASASREEGRLERFFQQQGDRTP
ncbi:ABC-2 type transport system ATP-binding protein [Archangium gephyra]|uniref:ABC-2 type transport system ATP-binding protein n=1 Tax=Archangium gephyra TaxID=48 RepID=A0ABX9JU79_9BACT|nr:ABC transporter ATP-binding protein [Archangium gephyra]REG27157.1 ABC-2 type transport system ATP-binding protein [Archangium gephyra]